MNTLFRSSNSDNDNISLPSHTQSPIPSLPKSHSATTTAAAARRKNNNEFIVYVRHYNGDTRAIPIPHDDPSVFDAKTAYVNDITKMTKEDQQKFFARAQMVSSALIRGSSSSSRTPMHHQHAGNHNVHNNNNNFSDTQSIISSMNAAAAATAPSSSTRFSGVLGKSFAMKSVKVDDITFAARDGHVLQDTERLASLRVVEGMNYVDVFVIPFAPYRPEEPLLVVSPLFPLPNSTSQQQSSTQHHHHAPHPSCGKQPPTIKDFDFATAIADVHHHQQQQQQQSAAAADTIAFDAPANPFQHADSSTSLTSPIPPHRRSNTAEFPGEQSSSQLNNNNNNNENNNNEEQDLLGTTARTTSSSNKDETNITTTPLRQSANATSAVPQTKELTMREVSLPTMDQIRKRQNIFDASPEKSSSQQQQNKIDCGDLLVHVVPNHSIVIENSSSSGVDNNNNNNDNQQQQQKTISAQCVEHFCRLNYNTATHSHSPYQASPRYPNNNNKSQSRSNAQNQNQNQNNNFSAQTTKQLGNNVGPATHVTNNSITSNNTNEISIPESPIIAQPQQQGNHQKYNSSHQTKQQQQKEVSPTERRIQYFSEKYWSPVHAWVSPDGNYVIVHIIEKELSNSSFVNVSAAAAELNQNNNNNQNNNIKKQLRSPSTAFLVYESAARGSSWVVKGAFRLPLDDITISGWACENKFVLCIGMTHCVVRVGGGDDDQFLGGPMNNNTSTTSGISVRCSTLIKNSIVEKSSATMSTKSLTGDDASSPPLLSSSSRRFYPALQIIRTLPNYLDGTLLWYDTRSSLLKIYHPGVATNNNTINALTENITSLSSSGGSFVTGGSGLQSQQQQLLSNSGFAIHFKRRIDAQHALNYNYLLQSRSPKWNLTSSSALPQFVMSPSDTNFQGFSLEETSGRVVMLNDSNNTKSNTTSSVKSPSASASASTTNKDKNSSSSFSQQQQQQQHQQSRPVPKAMYLLHRSVAETAPDPPSESFLLVFPKYLIHVSEHQTTTAGVSSPPPPPTKSPASPNTTSNNSNKNFNASSSSNDNNNMMFSASSSNILREDKFITSYIKPSIVEGNIVCVQYAKASSPNGHARLRVVYTHDDENTGVTSVHVVVLQAEWKDTKNVAAAAGGNTNNSSGNNSSQQDNNNKNNSSSGNNNSNNSGFFDYFKKKISAWRGSSDDQLAANASKEAERVAMATHKQLRFEGGGYMQAFQHGACDCFMATGAPVGLIVKATGSGGVAVVRLRASLQGS